MVDILRNILTLWQVDHLATLYILVIFYPRILGVVEASQRVLNDLKRLRLLAHSDNLARHNLIGGYVDHLAVDRDVAMEHQLACGSTSRSDAQTINHVVET